MANLKNKVEDNFYFPFEINLVEDEINSKLLEDFHGEKTGFVQVGPKKYFFPISYKKHATNYYNFEAREDDVWVVTFPRSGTTLTQELVWLIANDLDFKKALDIPQIHRFPFFEFGLFFHEDIKKYLINENKHSIENLKQLDEIMKHGWEFLPNVKERRFIKTHFPFSLLPKDIFNKKCKIIYVARNPKDIVVSYFHLNRLFITQGFNGTFSKYWEYFEQNLQTWMPYWDHLLEGWEHRNNPNILFLFYEDIVENMKSTIKTVANFLNKKLTVEQMNELSNYLDFENFRNNPSVNLNEFKILKITKLEEQGFIRKGKNGINEEWTEELNDRIDNWIKNNLKNTDFKFPKINIKRKLN